MIVSSPSSWLGLALAFLPSVIRSATLTGRLNRVKEIVTPPTGWVQHISAPADHVIELRIGLPQPNFKILEQHLYEVSDPCHERYGQHLSKEAVETLVAPHPESVDAVNEWLMSHGFLQSDIVQSPAQDWVTIKASVTLAEKMLDTTYHVWKHTESGDSIVRTTSYSLPQYLYDHVDVIQPTTTFARFRNYKSTVHWVNSSGVTTGLGNAAYASCDHQDCGVDPSCDTAITISCLKQLYNTIDYNASSNGGNQIGVTGYLDQFANIADLQTFYANQSLAALNSNFSLISINGGINSQNLSEAGVEANLDTQFAFGLTYPTPGIFYSTRGSPPFTPDARTAANTNEPYLDWLDFVLSHDNLPQTISTSYGDDEQTLPPDFARRVCNGFAQLGARGVSLLFSSGDGGAGDGDGDPATQKCFTNDGRNATQFIPAFPASCPYVTAVGGTEHIQPEVAVSFSGGGFSNYFSRPAYQDCTVRRFLAGLPEGTYEGLFNRSGRGIPDVSAQASNYVVFIGGQASLVGGTSAASPTFAAIVSLLNDARLSSGRPPLGFLNPFLYSKGIAGLTDITSGNAPGCGTQGFNATEGWDPVTGLGTPQFQALLKLLS